MNKPNRFRLSLRWFLLFVCAAGLGLGFLGRNWLAPQPDYNIKAFRVGKNHRVEMMVETVSNRHQILYAVFIPDGEMGPILCRFQRGKHPPASPPMYELCPDGIFFGNSPLKSNGARIWIGRNRGSFSIDPWEEIDETTMLGILAHTLEVHDYRALQVPYVIDHVLPVMDREAAQFWKWKMGEN